MQLKGSEAFYKVTIALNQSKQQSAHKSKQRRMDRLFVDFLKLSVYQKKWNVIKQSTSPIVNIYNSSTSPEVVDPVVDQGKDVLSVSLLSITWRLTFSRIQSF